MDLLVVAQADKELAINNALNIIDGAVAVLSLAQTFTASQKIARAAVTSGTPDPNLWVVGPADTGLTASVEAVAVLFDLSATRQFATGALTNQRAIQIKAPTYAFVGASTITTAATLSISGAPIAGTNATITNAHALNIESGNINVASGSVVITGLTNAPLQVTDPGSGAATISLIPKTGSKRTSLKFDTALQMGSDQAGSGTQDFWMQNLNTGRAVFTMATDDSLAIGATAGSGKVTIGAFAGASIAFFAGTPAVQQANASQAAITAVTDANAKSALQAIYNLLKNYNLAPATA